MNKIPISEQKKIMLDILKYIDKICRENNIEYSLCGGTLLGAIRHKGFIPWDDDIDIFLIRSEYERLLKILKTEKRYLLISPETSGFFQVYLKLVDRRTVMTMDNPNEPVIPNLGVNIDIFPIDGVPSNVNDQEEFVSSIRKLMYSMRMAMPRVYYNSDTSWKKNIKKIIYYPKHMYLRSKATPEEMKRKLLKMMQTYSFNNSTHAGFILSTYGKKEILPKDVFTGQIDIEFEGEKFRAFKGYESYLIAIYGNYMKLPPIEKRVSQHYFTAYWKE
ncbi:LicD family protein [Bacillus timonensis]|uniref:LicD family protein n=1 Tax=Bacillus timonensis TaxID=1033734 RepID=UPI000288689D|nr:LicD family protein [Bacillus timonensis]